MQIECVFQKGKVFKEDFKELTVSVGKQVTCIRYTVRCVCYNDIAVASLNSHFHWRITMALTWGTLSTGERNPPHRLTTPDGKMWVKHRWGLPHPPRSSPVTQVGVGWGGGPLIYIFCYFSERHFVWLILFIILNLVMNLFLFCFCLGLNCSQNC